MVDIHYQRGWRSGVGLDEVLRQNQATDIKQRFTSSGPQRADILIRSSAVKSGRKLSRGQLKMLASAFHFAQSQLALDRADIRQILLFDDLAAEVDQVNRGHLLNTLQSLYPQAFLTALEPKDLAVSYNCENMFHVEHGEVSKRGV